MEQTKTYERFPGWIVVLSNVVGLSIYVLGAYVLAAFGRWISGLYLLYCLGLELRLLQGHCVNCYYYGKTCGFGKGKLCAWLFKPGDPQKFTEPKISWVNMLPDFVVLVWPVVGGIILLVQDFSWLLTGMLLLLIVLSLSGNALVRGSLACKNCRQSSNSRYRVELPSFVFLRKKIKVDKLLAIAQPVEDAGKNCDKMRSFWSQDGLPLGSEINLVWLSRAKDNYSFYFVTIEQSAKNILQRGKFQGVK